jgi:hypothetical protein
MNPEPEKQSALKRFLEGYHHFTRSWTFYRPFLRLLLALSPIFGLWLGGTLFQGNFFGSWLVFAIIALPVIPFYFYFICTWKSRLPDEDYHFFGVDSVAFVLIIGYLWLLIGAPIYLKEKFLNDMHCLFKTQSCNEGKYRLDNADK